MKRSAPPRPARPIKIGDRGACTYIAAMCGRFTHRYTWADIHRLYRLMSPASNVQPSYNVCPTDTVNVVTSSDDTRILQPMRWGLVPRWWSKPLKELMRLSTFNARVETVTTKPFFREAFKHTRCIIPASGYYEWQDTPGGKQPHYFTRTDGQVISFAGLWDEWKDRATGETVKSCTMIITEPNAMVAEVHDRMPVVLEPDQFTPWLENQAGLEILTPAGEGVLQRWPVSKRVNSSKAPKDDETLTQPVAMELRSSKSSFMGAIMAMKPLVSVDRPVVRIWHPDDPKQYVELQFESQEAANNAVGHLNSALEWASGMEFGEDE